MTLIKDQLLKAIRYAARHNPDVQVETAWLTQQQMAELFRVDKSGISCRLTTGAGNVWKGQKSKLT